MQKSVLKDSNAVNVGCVRVNESCGPRISLDEGGTINVAVFHIDMSAPGKIRKS